MSNRLLLVLLVVFLVNCSSRQSQQIPNHIQQLDSLTSYPADAQPARDIKLAKDVTYRDTSQVMFGPMIRGVEVDEQGQVYLLDFRQNKIHVFAGNGSFRKSMKVSGRGPGELIMPWQMRATNNQLHLLGYVQQKISVFDAQTLEHIQDVPVGISEKTGTEPSWMSWAQKNQFSYRPITFFVHPDGNYFIFFGDEDVGSGRNLSDRTYEVSLYDLSVQQYVQYDLLSFDWTGQMMAAEVGDGMRFTPDTPYIRSSQFDFANGRLVQGWTDDFLFKFYDEQGNYQRAIYYPFEKVPLIEEKALSHHRLLGVQEAVRNDTLPHSWPAFNSVVMDDQGRLWVSTFTEDPNMYKWLVLESSGKLLAEFNWPARRKLQEVQGGFAYTLERNPQTGLQKVMRYRFEIN